MKHVITCLFLCSFVYASAQNKSVSSAPNTLAPAVTSSANISLTLYNAISIEPAVQWTYATTFHTIADFNGSTNAADMGSNVWNIRSTRPGNISLMFGNLMSTPPVMTIIPANKMSYKVNNAANWSTVSNFVPNIASFAAGSSNSFTMGLKVNPGWNYPGGYYGGYVIVTATQL